MQISSDQIKVYPTSRRSLEKDFNSKLNSEQNIVSIINRLADKKSFVIDNIITGDPGQQSLIDQLNSALTTYTIYKGSVNIDGYYFNITQDQEIDKPTTLDDLMFLAFRIRLSDEQGEIDIGGVPYTSTYKELVGIDTGDKYTGLELVFTDRLSTDYTYLVLAKYSDGVWSLENCTLKYNAKSININFVPGDNENIENKVPAKNAQIDTNLYDWLADNFIIDDGELT